MTRHRIYQTSGNMLVAAGGAMALCWLPGWHGAALAFVVVVANVLGHGEGVER